MSRSRLAVVLTTALLVLAGSATPQSLPYGPGERLDFNLKWRLGIGGRAAMTVTEGPDSFWTMVTTARSTGLLEVLYPVRDTLATVMSPASLLPVRFEKHQNEGFYHRDSVYIFDQRRGLIKSDGKMFPAPERIFDTLSLLYLVRTRRLEVGRTVAANVYEGGKFYLVEMRVVRRETVTVPAGRFSCLVIEPAIVSGGSANKKGRMWIWLTDDARRMPVLIHTAISAGRIIAELSAWRPADGTVSSSSPR